MDPLRSSATHPCAVFPLLMGPGRNWEHDPQDKRGPHELRLARCEELFFRAILHVVLVEVGLRWYLNGEARDKDTFYVLTMNSTIQEYIRMWLKLVLPPLMTQLLRDRRVPENLLTKHTTLKALELGGFLRFANVRAANGIDCTSALLVTPHRGFHLFPWFHLPL